MLGWSYGIEPGTVPFTDEVYIDKNTRVGCETIQHAADCRASRLGGDEHKMNWVQKSPDMIGQDSTGSF